MKKFMMLFVFGLGAFALWGADAYKYDKSGGTATLSSSINSTGRFVIYQGTVNVPSGITVQVGGDTVGACNFIGIDRNNSSGTLNINGGTFWCDKSKGAGYLAVGNNNNNAQSYVNLNSGELKVDVLLRMSTIWSSSDGVTSSGTVNVNGGTATIANVQLGANTDNTGVSTFNLNGGTLITPSITFLKYNGQNFSFAGGTLQTTGAHVFKPLTYLSTKKTRTIQVAAGKTSVVDTQGFDQNFPIMTGTGVLSFTGGGALDFAHANLSYGLAFTAGTYKLAAGLSMKSLAFSGTAKVKVDAPTAMRGGVVFTTTDGVTIPNGSKISDFIEIDHGQLAISGDGKRVVVTSAANTPYVAYWTNGAGNGQVDDSGNWDCRDVNGTVLADALPAASTYVCLTGSTAGLPAAATAARGVKFVFGDLLRHTSLVWNRIGYGANRSDTQGFPFLSTSPSSYVYQGAGDLNNLRGASTTWQTSYLKQSELRFEGWFYVSSDEAGTWSFEQYFDDYYAFAIDGDWVVANQTFQTKLTATANVTAGWHRFTVIAGDTYGGFGASLTASDGLGTRAILVTTPNQKSVPFESHVFTFGDEEHPVATLAADLDLRGIDAQYLLGATIDLNGHNLDMDSLPQDLAQGGFIITDSSTRDAGTLRLHVAAGQALTNNVVRFAGSAKVQKLGGGTLRLNITGQTTSGSFDIREGKVEANNDTCYGMAGREVFVRSGAILDTLGGGGYCNNIYVLDGGTVTNTGTDLPDGWSQFAHLRLTADSFLTGNTMNVINSNWVASDFDFQGHMLTVSMNAGKIFRLSTVTDKAPGGTIRIVSGAVAMRNKESNLHYMDFIVESGAGLTTSGKDDPWSTSGGAYLHTLNITCNDGSLNGLSWGYINGDVTLDGTEARTFTMPVQVRGRLVKKGTGTVTVTPNSSVKNQFLGGVDVQAGALVMGVANGLDNGNYTDFHVASGASLTLMATKVRNFTIDAGATINWNGTPLVELSGALTGLASMPGALTLMAGANVVLPSGTSSFTVGGALTRSGAATIDASTLFANGDPDTNELTVLTAASITGTGALTVTGCPEGWSSSIQGSSIVLKRAGTEVTDFPLLVLDATPTANQLAGFSANLPALAPGLYTLATWPTSTTQPAYGLPTVKFPADFDLEWEILPFATNVVLHVKSAAESALAPIKIWCVGDTFVEKSGGTGNPNWRIPLAQYLSCAGWNPQMTGFRTTYQTTASGAAPKAAWTGHTGFSGAHYKITSSSGTMGLLQGLDTFAWAAERPDFTILSSGIHDYYDGLSSAAIFESWSNACVRILAALPGTTLIATTLTDAQHSNADRQANRVAVNDLIRAFCAKTPEEGGFPAGRVELVDVDAIYAPSMEGYYANNYEATWLGADAVAQAFATKLMTLATAEGKLNTSFNYPAINNVFGAKNNVPDAYTTGFVHVRTLEPTKSANYAQNVDAVPYSYRPAVAETGIAKSAYYIELVRADSGEMKAMWIDMDAPGSNLDDITLPVTHAQRKQKTVTKLHVWSTFGGVSQVAASDDSVSGYLEFNPVNYGGTAKNINNAAAETWSGVCDWNDSLTESGSSGYGCFQIFRKAPPDGLPAEVLFAFNNWGSSHGDNSAIGFGTFANTGLFGSASLDWTFVTGNSGDVAKINAGGYSLCRIEFWVKYTSGSGTADFASLADATWTGATSADFATPGNWNDKNGKVCTTIANLYLYLPPHAGDPSAFTYGGADAVTGGQHILFGGGYAFPTVGAFNFNSWDFGAQGRLVFDPTKVTLRSASAPTFVEGFKFALDAKYAAYTKGRFQLIEWDQGALDLSFDANLLFDTASAQGANVRVWAENLATGGGRLWLDLDATEGALTKIRVMPVGDSITQGSQSTYGNWRIPLMKKLLAAGYDPTSTGFWKIQSFDETGATVPEAWSWHAGISGRRLLSGAGGGVAEALGTEVDQAGDVDALLLLIGTNDINGDNVSASRLFQGWQDTILRALTMTSAKIFCGSIVDMANDATKDAKVVEFNTMMRQAIETDHVFGTDRVYYVDLYTPCYRYDGSGNYITGSFYSATDVHPDWPGEDKMADAWCAAIKTALPGAMPSHAAEYTVTTGVEANVPAAYRNGFKRARVLDVKAAAARGAMKINTTVPYEDFTDEEGATTDLSRVGYYVEMKRKDTALTDYGDRVRWLWVDMDAFGARDLETVGVPLFTGKVTQNKVTRLHTIGNMPGVRTVAADDDTEEGWVEFWPDSYSDAATSIAGAAANLRGFDWNDSRNEGVYGSMQVHLLTPTAFNPAEVLFAFNRWTSDANFEMGLGNFSLHDKNSLDWTFTSQCNLASVMGLGAYEVARIEIWTIGVTEDPDVQGAVTTVDGVDFAEGTALVTGTLSSYGTAGSSATVRFEWSTDPAFGTVTGQTDLGTFTGSCPKAISATATDLDPTQSWYFRFVTVNDRNVTASTQKPGAYDISTVTWRPQSTTDTWASAAWLKEGASATAFFNNGWTVLFDGEETTRPNMVAVPNDVKTSGLTVKGALDYNFVSSGKTITTPSLVKDGTGTLTLDGVALAGVKDGITVNAGTFKLGDNAVANVLGEPGTRVRIKDGACFDLNFTGTAAGESARSTLTQNAVFEIEGAGPDGKGVLVDSAARSYWGFQYRRLELTGDATIGGSSCFDVRPLSSAASTVTPGIFGSDYDLTIKNTGIFRLVSASLDVASVLVTDGGVFRPESIAEGNVKVPGGLTLDNGTLYGYGSTFPASMGLNVTAKGGVVDMQSGTTYFKGPLTLAENAPLTVQGSSTAYAYFQGAVTNNGIIEVKNGNAYFQGKTENAFAINANGGNTYLAVKTAGELDVTATSGSLYLDSGFEAEDFTIKYAGGLPYLYNMPKFKNLTYNGQFFGIKTDTLGGPTFETATVTSNNGSFDVLPQAAGEANVTGVLTVNKTGGTMFVYGPNNTAEHDMAMTLKGNIATTWIGLNSKRKGGLRLKEGSDVTIGNVRLGQGGSGPSAGKLVIDPGAKLTISGSLWNGEWSGTPDIAQKHVIDVGGTLIALNNTTYLAFDVPRSEMFLRAGGFMALKGLQNRNSSSYGNGVGAGEGWHRFRMQGGTFEMGASGFQDEQRVPGVSLFDLANGTLTNTAAWGASNGMSIYIGETMVGGHLTYDLGSSLVNWNTGLAGSSALTLKGAANFQGNRKNDRLQGAMLGKVTVENTGNNDLRNAGVFGGGLELAAGTHAEIGSWGDEKYAYTVAGTGNMNGITATAWSYPFASANFFDFMHAYNSSNPYAGNTGFAGRGEFYVPADKAGKWTFAGCYDDFIYFLVDGANVIASGGTKCGSYAGTIELTEGWHTFTFWVGDAGGVCGPTGTNWKNKGASLGFLVGESTSKDANTYTKFAPGASLGGDATLQIRPYANAMIWSYQNGSGNWDTTENWTHVLARKSVDIMHWHSGRSDAATYKAYLAGKVNRFEGWFKVEDNQEGEWTFKMGYDDNKLLNIDGQRVVNTGAWNATVSGKKTLTPGWHRWEARVQDGSGGWGPSAANGGNTLSFIAPGAAEKQWNETNLKLAATLGDIAVLDRTGIYKDLTVGAGATLTSSGSQAMPIFGTLKGTGTLSGSFAFDGDNNCWEVTSGPRRNDVQSVTFNNPNANTHAGLKNLKVTFTAKPTTVAYDLGNAMGAKPADIKLEVKGTDGTNYTDQFSLEVRNGKLTLVNAKPGGMVVVIR